MSTIYKKENLTCAKAFLALALLLGTGLVHATAIYSATALGQLRIYSVTDSQGNDASSSVEISLEPGIGSNPGPYVDNEGYFWTGGGFASSDGTVDSRLINAPNNPNPFDLEQRSNVFGDASGGSAISNHSTFGALGLSLIDNVSGPITVTFELSYSTSVFTDLDNSSLESAVAHAMFELTDYLGIKSLEGFDVDPTIFNITSDLYAEGAGVNNNDSFTKDRILFSVGYDPDPLFNPNPNSPIQFDRITLRTLVSGEANSVPEPATLALFVAGLLGLRCFRRLEA